MKKLISFALALVLGTGLLVGAGCSHKHEFGSWYVVVPASCVRTGLERRDCAVCEESQERPIPMTEHTISSVYSADGTKHWKECSVCRQHFEEGDHNFTGDLCSVCKYDKSGTNVLEYKLNEDGESYALTGVLGTAPESVVVPAFYIGLPVTKIAKNAFLGQRAMKNITLPAGITEIESEAFKGCIALTRIELPASVQLVGSGAFSDCTALSAIDVAAGNEFFSSECGILYDLLKTKFIHIPAAVSGEVILPATITEISGGEFAGRHSLEKITIGENITSVGGLAFQNCTSLTEFTVLGQNTVFGLGALDGCTSLSKLVLANTWQSGLTEPYSNPDNTMNGSGYLGYLFGAEFCLGTGSKLPASLKTVEFTGGTKLYGYAFANCDHIETIVLPDTLREISDNVFFNCSALKALSIGAENTVFTVRNNILYNRERKEIVHVPAALEGDVEILDGVRQIAANAFEKRAITGITLPASVERIGNSAFSECANLARVTIPDESKLISFGDLSFFMCQSLTSIVIPARTATIGKSAFWGSGLTEAFFRETQGWRRAGSIDMQSSTEVSPGMLAVPSAAADELTGANSQYYWSRTTT